MKKSNNVSSSVATSARLTSAQPTASKRSLVIGLSLAATALVAVLDSGIAIAQSNTLNDGFERFIRDQACPASIDKSANLQNLCAGPVMAQAADLGTNRFSSDLNLGSMSALGHAALFSLDLRKQQVFQRFKLFQQSGQGGGASADRRLFDVFASAQYGQSERDSTALEAGYDSDIKGGLLGFDVNWTRRFMTGLAFGASKDTTNIDNTGGQVETTGYSATFYTSFAPTPSSYIGAYGAFTRFWYDTERGIRFGTLTERAVADSLGQQLVIGLSGGYTWLRGPWSIGGYANVDWAKSEVEQYSERQATLGLQYNDQNIYSVTSTLGLRGTYEHPTSWGVLMPELRLAWIHEYDNGARSVDVQLVQGSGPSFAITTDEPDTNYFRMGTGVTAKLPSDTTMFLDYGRTVGHKYLDSWLLNAGVIIGF